MCEQLHSYPDLSLSLSIDISYDPYVCTARTVQYSTLQREISLRVRCNREASFRNQVSSDF